jgi:hypothetical protein
MQAVNCGISLQLACIALSHLLKVENSAPRSALPIFRGLRPRGAKKIAKILPLRDYTKPRMEFSHGLKESCIRRGYADQCWFCRLSGRMFNLLLSDCGCPRMLSFLPDRVTGLLKIRISEHPYSYCDQLGALLGFPENRSPAFWTKVECHSSTAICSTRVSFGNALS